MVRLAAFDETVVDRLAGWDEDIRSGHQPVSAFRHRKQFPRARLGAVKRSSTRDTQTNEIPDITGGFVPVAAVGILEEIVSGDNAELPEFGHATDLRFIEAVAAIPFVENRSTISTAGRCATLVRHGLW